MTTLLKTLLGIIFTAYVAFITWGNLSLPQKHWVFDLFGIPFDRTLPISNQAGTDNTQPLHVTGPASSPESKQPARSSGAPIPLKETLLSGVEKHAIPALCLKTNTRSITTVEKTGSIFRWTDQNGQVHFSDSKPSQQASDEITANYRSDKQFFRMNLTSPEQVLPTLLGEQLQRDVSAIFGYLSDRMASQYLRQVDLNLKVFNSAKGFEQYRQAHAPSLKSAAGFYTALNNEAVVMRQRYDQHTRAIARHETTHVINAGLFGRTPIWFNEGIAEFFESYEYSGLKAGATNTNRYHLRHLSTLLKQGQLPSLRDYLTLSDLEWRSRNQRTMYSLAWSVIYLLQNHQKGEQFTRHLLAEMAENPCSELDTLQFWDKHYPGGLSAFESRWRIMLQTAREG
ncbi:DUF1570 domain-containing protein [Alkalimarinus coralli]|uniref:DUF1570 domain-containing protein n=1 Tax=Alkalimarinus coralli TaxID=2935863 RepID=UPI00202B13A3|nr:DUF1570 domain-containing protein [Alkalimarinus coralli]